MGVAGDSGPGWSGPGWSGDSWTEDANARFVQAIRADRCVGKRSCVCTYTSRQRVRVRLVCVAFWTEDETRRSV